MSPRMATAPDEAAGASQASPPDAPASPTPLEAHPAWDTGTGRKRHLNHLRLLLQPYACSCLLLPAPACSCLLLPWLALVPLPHAQAVHAGLAALGSLVNAFRLALPT
jgi:hypothetical protein